MNCEKSKYVTFSYDDGVLQDRRLIEIFNKYSLKATFNLNSSLFGKEESLIRDGVKIDHTRIKKEDIKYIYDGHEIAAHTLTHPNLTSVKDEDEIFSQVENDRINLSEIAGYEVKGFAYPGGGVNFNEKVKNVIKKSPYIKYARTIVVTYNFDICADPFELKGTLYHHEDWDRLFKIGKDFLNLKCNTPKMLYIWGHSYEFDIYPERWEMFEKFCEMISGKDDIFYGTNIECLERLEKQI